MTSIKNTPQNLLRKRSAARVKVQDDSESDAGVAAAADVDAGTVAPGVKAPADRRGSRVASFEHHDIDPHTLATKTTEVDGSGTKWSCSSLIPRMSRNDIIWFFLGLCNNVVWVIGCELYSLFL